MKAYSSLFLRQNETRTKMSPTMKFRNLGKYRTGRTSSNMKLSLPLPRTPEGRTYRYSPNETAHPRHFLIGEVQGEPSESEVQTERMRQQPRLPRTVCPYSGIIDEDQVFIHPEDLKAAQELVAHEAQKDVAAEMEKMARDFNRGQRRNDLIKMSMSVNSPKRLRPRFYRRDLMRALVCDACQRDYAVFALSLFCPDCGAPNVHLHFQREYELAHKQVRLAEGLDGQEELAYRLLGNAHEDVLTAFEATLKMVFRYRFTIDESDEKLPRVGNDFQNIEKARKRFAKWSFDPFAVLSSEEINQLSLDIQKRHIIGHNLGIADDKFATHSDETKIGETIKLVGEDILGFAKTCEKVIGNVNDWLAGLPTPDPSEGAEVKLPSDSEPPSVAAKIAKEFDLSEEAAELGLHVVQSNETGMRDLVRSQDLKEHSPDWTDKKLSQAIAELEVDQFVSCLRTLGGGVPDFRIELELYASFDPLGADNDPMLDAAKLAEITLRQDKPGNVEGLHEHSDWPLRRFNPALSIMLTHIDDRRISRAGYGKYPTRHFGLLDEDRVALRRFAKRFSSD